MTNRNKITVSFLPHEKDLWQFIQSKKKACNISEYIRDLIRKDMTNNSSSNDEERLLEKLLQAFKENNIINTGKTESIEETLESDEAKEAINSLF